MKSIVAEALFYAVSCTAVDAARLLLEELGADGSGITTLDKDDTPVSLVAVAARRGSMPMLDLLLGAGGADINSPAGTDQTKSPLLVACQRSNLAMAKALLQRNARVEPANPDQCPRDTVPLLAAKNDSLIELLFQHGANACVTSLAASMLIIPADESTAAKTKAKEKIKEKKSTKTPPPVAKRRTTVYRRCVASVSVRDDFLATPHSLVAHFPAAATATAVATTTATTSTLSKSLTAKRVPPSVIPRKWIRGAITLAEANVAAARVTLRRPEIKAAAEKALEQLLAENGTHPSYNGHHNMTMLTVMRCTALLDLLSRIECGDQKTSAVAVAAARAFKAAMEAAGKVAECKDVLFKSLKNWTPGAMLSTFSPAQRAAHKLLVQYFPDFVECSICSDPYQLPFPALQGAPRAPASSSVAPPPGSARAADGGGDGSDGSMIPMFPCVPHSGMERFTKQTCGHVTCKSCLEQWVLSELAAHKTVIRCMHPGCSVVMYASDILRAAGKAAAKTFQELITTDHRERLLEMMEGGLNDFQNESQTRPCPSCRVVIHRSSGCDDFICRCGFRFHFTNAKWPNLDELKAEIAVNQKASSAAVPVAATPAPALHTVVRHVPSTVPQAVPVV